MSNQWAERGKRLLYMDAEELRARLTQEARKRWDSLCRHLDILPIRHDARFVSQPFGRFFFGHDELPGILGCLRERLPHEVESTVKQAEQICRHRFDLLGYEGVGYGSDIDWHLDAVHGKRAPLYPWYRVPFLDFARVGDSKVIWELSRHQHLVTLARAYRFTDDVRFATELFRQWYHWHEKNPYGMGINWASSLEVAFRSLSWFWVWFLLDGCAAVPQRFSRDLRRALWLNAHHIERFLSTYYSPNTHLLGEGVGLFFTGVLCPGSVEAQRWQQVGWHIVLREARKQVLTDGMHFEQSTYYHTYAVDFLLHARILARRNGISTPTPLLETLESMLDATCALSKAGAFPRFGDDDGGRVFNQRRNRAEHLVDPLATGAVLFHRGDFKAAVRGLREETVWLLGPEGVRRFDQLPSLPLSPSSVAFPASGVYLMASSQPDVQQTVIDAGPLGAGRAGHGHADALSVQMSVNGEPLILDPGTFAYVGPANARDEFRGTAAHSTVQIGSLSQAEPAGPFGWKHIPTARAERWVTGKHFDFFSGSHTGYERLPQPVRHHRSVFYAKPRYLLVRDVMDGQGSHQCDIRWHLAPGVLTAFPGGLQYAGNGGLSLTLLVSARANTQTVHKGWHSPVYGQKAPSLILEFSTHILPADFVTLLIPMTKGNPGQRGLEPFESTAREGRVRGYRYWEIRRNDFFFFPLDAGHWRLGVWASDARFFYCSTNQRGELTHFFVCEGSYVERNGRRLFSSPSGVATQEWTLQGDLNPAHSGQSADLSADQEFDWPELHFAH